MQFEFVRSIDEIGAGVWNRLDSSGSPFTRFEFLQALESSGCVGGDSGWHPRHLLISDGGKPIAAMPLYRKEHSYGEYVFDWAWAQAWAQYGQNYYPKLVNAIPFTPVPGPRLLVQSQEGFPEVVQAAAEAIENLCHKAGYSGWHMLFPQPELVELLQPDMLLRKDVQFHWHNRDYPDFDAFLADLRSSKRKQIRRERRRVAEQGVYLQRLSGQQLTGEAMEAFYHCYCETYLRRSGHSGYLNRQFFQRIAETMAEQIMLVLAWREEQVVAASLFLFDSDNLYGRYWGALDDIDCLHFEACYYQGIEFAIEAGLAQFNPGTQGEHKLVRGFEPVQTNSLHWVSDRRFQPALQDFLHRETQYKEEYRDATRDCLPFRRGQ